MNNTDNSLLGTNPNGVNNSAVDEPQYSGSPRRFFYGPGSDNFDMALSKKVGFTESMGLLFRLEAFNVFNHTQFFGPLSVNGTLGSPAFGQVVSAAAPRIVQAAVKFTF